MKKIVIFASGAGSNAENIILHFKNNSKVSVVAVFSNNKDAKVIEKATNHNVPVVVFDKKQLSETYVLEKINQIQPDLIILAGFLWKFPSNIIQHYTNKIINIHPALLPKYGGKGMFGLNVHQSVLENNEKETGITIHYVNEHYDEGGIIFQKTVTIENCDTAEAIADKVHTLEHRYFPKVIEQLLTTKS
jgi:phosphoribosylglycinamide formyltransferase-1